VKNRKREPGETLRSLYSDIRRLVALALPRFDRKARETMACDYFIDALNDTDFALKVRERSPQDLDTALRIDLQLELWSADVDRNRRDHAAKDRRAREMARAENRAEETTEMLKKQVAEGISSRPAEREWLLTRKPKTSRYNRTELYRKQLLKKRDNRMKEHAGGVVIRIIDCGNA